MDYEIHYNTIEWKIIVELYKKGKSMREIPNTIDYSKNMTFKALHQVKNLKQEKEINP